MVLWCGAVGDADQSGMSHRFNPSMSEFEYMHVFNQSINECMHVFTHRSRMRVWRAWLSLMAWQQRGVIHACMHVTTLAHTQSHRLSLPIPSSCPEILAVLLTQVRIVRVFPCPVLDLCVSVQCWQADTRHRPSFRKIIRGLEEVCVFASTHPLKHIPMHTKW